MSDEIHILQEYEKQIKNTLKYHLGYPYNLSNEFPEELLTLTKYSINNLGDPFIESNYGVHSRSFETAVLQWFAYLWKIPFVKYWGYVCCSGTEGNFSGLLIGRDNYPTAILYASEDSHYSVFKAAHMYRMDFEKVKSNVNGTINIKDFESCLEKHPNVPAIVNANVGTTMKGGIDDIDQIINILKKHNKEFYIHCDGALSGIIASDLSFQKDIASISVSGHKFIGCPFPCGVIIVRKQYQEKLGREIDYIGSRDTTIMGSRNGHAPIFLWYLLAKKSKAQIYEEYNNCIVNALYLELAMKDEFVMRNGITVVIKKPSSQEFIKKWQLACSGDICHIVVMPNVTKEIIDKFVKQYFIIISNA